MAPHTHDDIDWAERIPALRRADELHAPVHAEIAARLVDQLGPGPVVVDAGSGAGGMSSAFAAALARHGGGTLVLVDAVPELVEVAQGVARAAVDQAHAAAVADQPASNTAAAASHISSGGHPLEVEQARADIDGGVAAATVGRAHPGPGAVSAAASGAQVVIDTVLADVASVELGQIVPAADLVWAASMVHHLPDQQAGIAGLVSGLKPRGTLALVEGSPPTYCLPWDLGIGEPGLERRLLAARERWFGQMRAGMPGSVRMPYGWNVALAKAGLERVGSFSRLVDFPAPPDDTVRNYVMEHIAWLGSAGEELITQEDREVLHRLLDPADPACLARRDDLYVLGVQTVHFGSKP
ncbi:class I SAM-dependent methyltransferase [Amycolatopsis thermophila]|uniref:SAM-dependent methyltransferase n=1 Tax=Amycolatopsis thermophila TaxID=206084 RepID=A0ABU0EPM8_9PSEU|nr:class I SAM-dependent methyltransferase [Amycolatopsis thermophila]MDQ0377124.1 SAM-dependent methyltransferase [Amycolatopsis thermophila]